MAKLHRSPLLGYNHNVKYKGRIYHVQTEDSGPQNPHLSTHLYFAGTILATKRHEYDGGAPEDVIRGLMQGQHKAILKELLASRFDGKLTGFFESRGEAMLAADEEGEVPAPLPLIEGPTEPTAPPAILLDEALDLDALPIGAGPTPSPEPQPMGDYAPSGPGGPGVYTMKKPARPERVASGNSRPSQVMPLVVFEDPSKPPPLPAGRTTSPAVTPGAQPSPSMGGAGRPGSQPAMAAAQTPPPAGDGSVVVVQRQVVVGVGGSRAPTVNRARRPAPSIPYVVKEGSHPTVNSQRPSTAAPARPGTAPPAPRPLVPAAPTSANASRTSTTGPQRPADLISDKSLDEVILAYLSQGDGETR